MDDIDYKELAKVVVVEYRATWANYGSVDWQAVARAVVASLREQGLAVVRADDARTVLGWGDRIYSRDPDWKPADWNASARIRAALAAPCDGGEGN